MFHNADLSPPPDDSLVTLASSLTRISTKSFVLKAGNGCSVHPGSVLEVTSYHNNDNYKVFLVILLLIIMIQVFVLINIKKMIMGNIMPFKSIIWTNILVEHAGSCCNLKCEWVL